MSSRSNSSLPSKRSQRIVEQNSKPNENKVNIRKNSSNSSVRSRSPKRTSIKSQSPKRKNSSVCSRSNSIQRKSPKRERIVNSSRSRSRSNSPRKVVKKNSSDKSKGSSRSRSPPKHNSFNNNGDGNNYNSSFNNRNDGNDDFRGRGRGRGRGGDRGRGRGGGFNNNNRSNNFDRNNNNSYDRNNNNSYGGNNNRNYDNNDNNDNLNNSGSSLNNNNNNNFNNKPKQPQLPPTKQQLRLQRLESFFNQHKLQGWFKQKYHPVTMLALLNQRRHCIQSQKNKFIQKLTSGYFDDINLTILDYKKLGSIAFMQQQQGQVNQSNHVINTLLFLNPYVNVINAPFYGQQTDNSTLFIQQIHKQIYRFQLYDQCSKFNGFKGLILNQPSRSNQFKRMAWVEYQKQEDAQKAMDGLKEIIIKGNKINVTKASKKVKKTRLILNYTNDRLKKDVQIIVELAMKLDLQAKISQNNPIYSFKYKSVKQMFEIFLMYLRKVHFFQYFQSKFYDSYRTLCVKSGLTVLFTQAIKDQQIDRQQLQKLDIQNSLIKQNGSYEYFKKQHQSISILNEQLKTLISYHSSNNPSLSTAKYQKCFQCYKKFITVDHLAKHLISRHDQLIEDNIIQPVYKKVYLMREEEYEKEKEKEKENPMIGISKKKKQQQNRFNNYEDYDEPEAIKLQGGDLGEDKEKKNVSSGFLKSVSERRLINFLDI